MTGIRTADVSLRGTLAIFILLALAALAAVLGHDLILGLAPLLVGVTMTTVEQREQLKAKKDTLKKLWDAAGDDLDLKKVIEAKLLPAEFNDTKKVQEEFKRQTDEINDLAQKLEIHEGREMLKALEEAWDNPAPTYPFPGVGGKKSKFYGKTLGDLVIESDAVKKYQKALRAGPSVEVQIDDEKEFERLMGTKTVLTETGYSIQAIRTGLILPGALRRPVVADLIPAGTTRTNAIVYMEETTATNAAAAVAEGAAKPESALAFSERNSPVRKIATVLPITDELLQDEPAMRAYVEARLRLFLQLAEETQLLTGSGVAPQILGLYNVSGINTQAKGADPTPDAIWKGMDLIRTTAFLEPDSVVLHTNDWQDIRLLRTADGLYIWGSPSEQGPQRIWGVPVVVTPGATQNTGLVLAAAQGMQLFRRAEVSFAIIAQPQHFFVLNQRMLRVEGRIALVFHRPKAICTVTGI